MCLCTSCECCNALSRTLLGCALWDVEEQNSVLNTCARTSCSSTVPTTQHTQISANQMMHYNS